MATARCALRIATVGTMLAAACTCGPPPESYSVGVDDTGSYPDPGSRSSWRRWGGPNGDFVVPAADLATSWPAAGPPVLWSRPLGEGYSAIVSDGAAVFTIYRDGAEDAVLALRADNGATVWEYRYPAKTYEQSLLDYGSGPNATPLILKDRVITLGFGGTLNALDLRSGRLLWSLDVVAQLGGQILEFGNSASPIPYGDTVIVLTGGKQAVVALDPADGSLIWRSDPGTVSYGTPIVIELDGQDQLVYTSETEAIGIDARTGERRWSHPSFNHNRDNISPPIWGRDDLLWVSTQPDGGTRVIHLDRVKDTTEVREVWSSKRVSIHHWNAIRLGEYVYASIGGQGSIFACVDVRTGEIGWRRRGFERVNLIQAGDKTILFDANGELALATLTPDGMTVLSQATVTDGVTWTVPTLLGTTLYIRDKKSIRALDLGVRP